MKEFTTLKNVGKSAFIYNLPLKLAIFVIASILVGYILFSIFQGVSLILALILWVLTIGGTYAYVSYYYKKHGIDAYNATSSKMKIFVEPKNIFKNL